jgi:hypothetical protein
MLQIDRSHHDWFEVRGPMCVSILIIDDASNITYARFYPADTTAAAFHVFGRWAKLYGPTRSVCADRHAIYRDEDHPEKPTQIGCAMVELGETPARTSPAGERRAGRYFYFFKTE